MEKVLEKSQSASRYHIHKVIRTARNVNGLRKFEKPYVNLSYVTYWQQNKDNNYD